MRVITAPLLLLVAQAWAQPNFIRRHELPNGMVVNGATVTPDQGVVVCGTSEYAGHDQGVVLKLDEGGAIQWSRTVVAGIPRIFPDTSDVDFRDVVTLDNGDVVLIGNTQRLVAEMNVGGRVVIRYDATTGDTIWREHSEAYVNGFQWYNDIAMDAMGRLILVGSRYSVYSHRSYLRVADPDNASSIIEKYYLRTENDMEDSGITVNHVTPLPDLGILATMNGYTSHVVRFDQNLDTIWSITWPFGTFEAAVRLNNDSYVAHGSTGIQQINADGTLGWSSVIGSPNARIRSMVPHPIDGFYLLGSENAAVPFSWLALMSTDGTVQWCRRYGIDNEAVVMKELLVMADGSLRMVGTVDDDLLVLATDGSGSMSGCISEDHDINIQVASNGPDPTLDLIVSGGLGDSEGEPVWNDEAFPIGPDSLYCHSGLWLITGSVFNDLNGDGARDGTELGLPFIPVRMVPEQTIHYADAEGELRITTVVDGPHELSVEPLFPWWTTTTSAASLAVDLDDADFTIEGMDIGLTQVMDTTIVVPSLLSGPTRCSNVVQQTLVALNQGTTVPDLLLSLTMDPLTTLVDAEPAADSSAGNIHYWHIDQLEAFQEGRILLDVQMPGVEAIGEELNAVFEVRDMSYADEVLSSHEWSSELTCAYDPNDKQVEPLGFGPEHVIAPDTEWLTYTVRFQNTGTDTAFAVVIRDALSPHVRPTTLEILGASHDLTRVNMNVGGQIAFHFDNILLPDSGANEPASQGFVRFRVRLVEDLPNGIVIANAAQIHFDQNPAIHTNQVFNTIFDCVSFTPWLEIAEWNTGQLEPYGEYIPDENGWNWTQTVPPYRIQWFLNGEPIPSSVGEDGYILPWLYPVGPGYYTVAITTNDGCVLVSEPFAYFPAGITSIANSSITLRPNPFNDRLQVRYPGTHDHLELVDVNGRTVRNQTTQNATTVILERGELAAGIYLLRMMDGSRVVATARVVAE